MFNDNFENSEDSEMSGDFITPNKNDKTTTTPPTTTVKPDSENENLESESLQNGFGNGETSNLNQIQNSKDKTSKRKDTCCGVYPKRLPFNPLSNTGAQKDCCNNKFIFNAISQMCCDGTVKDVGVC